MFFAAVGHVSRSSRRGRGVRLERCARNRGHGGSHIFVRLGDGELVELLLHCCRRRRKRTDTTVVCFTARYRLGGGRSFV